MTIPQDQNSDEWKEWRRSRIGASDLPIIIGKSKWCTPYRLWQRKLGFIPDIEDNWAMQRGRKLEPEARAMANEQLSMTFEPKVVAHSELEWAIASLDGIDKEHLSILEIKCPGLGDHQIAEQDRIPDHYYPQVQWQLFCADLPRCYYASFYEGELAIVKCLIDDEYIAETLLPAAAEFYQHMVTMTEPPRGDDEHIPINDADFGDYAREYKAADEMYGFYKEKREFYKDKLISCTDDSNCVGYGLKLTRCARDGRVDWKKLWKDLTERFPEVSDSFSPDDYKAEQIGYWKITKDK